MDEPPEVLEAAYSRMLELKLAALPRHHCNKCGGSWKIESTYFCIQCGTARCLECVSDLEAVENPPVFFPHVGQDAVILGRRCPCGGRVG